jgi:hypothetical protein
MAVVFLLGLAVAAPPAVAQIPSRPATVTKSGGRISCGGGGHIAIVANALGSIGYWLPAPTLRYQSYHISLFAEEWDSTQTSATSWKVTVDNGYLDDTGTYAFCVPPGGRPSLNVG